MSESQFGSRTLLRILDKKDAEIERLRELLLRCKPQIEAGYGHGRIDRELILELEKEVGNAILREG